MDDGEGGKEGTNEGSRLRIRRRSVRENGGF